MERKIVRVTIRGRVQGVGFRAWTEMEASTRGISGWVRNRSNGDVEALFAGPPEAVAALCAACWRGPPQARVTEVNTGIASEEELSLAGTRPGFRQIATFEAWNRPPRKQ
jgi:acylphosphatase